MNMGSCSHGYGEEWRGSDQHLYPKRRYRRGESWRQERESDNAII